MKVRLIAFQHRSQITGMSLDVLREAALSSAAVRDSVELSLRHYASEPDEQVLDDTLRDDPEVVAVSCYVWGLDRALRLAQRLAEVAADKLVVLGGPELCTVERDVLGRAPAVDVVVHDEGEDSFRELLEALVRGGQRPRPDRLGDVAGLSLRRPSGAIGATAPRARRPDVNAYPSPYLTGSYFEARRGGLTDHCAVIEQYRGCPFHCPFCSWGRGCAKLRWFDEGRVLAELDALERAGVPDLFFAEAAFSLDRGRARRLLQRLGGARFRRIDLHVDLDQLDDELCELLADEPSLVIDVGIQAVKHETLHELHRRPLQARHRERLARLGRGRAHVHHQAILGLPADRPEDFRATLGEGLALEGGPELQLFHLQVLPGSEYWARNAELELGASIEPPHFVQGRDQQGIERLQRMKLDAWLGTVLHNRDLLHFLGRTYAAALGLPRAAWPTALLWRLGEQLWQRAEHRELPDGVVRVADRATVERLLSAAHELLAQAGCPADAAADALALNRAIAHAHLSLCDPRRSSLRLWPMLGAEARVPVPWHELAPPDEASAAMVGHALALGDLQVGRLTAGRTPHSSLVWANAREVHVLETPAPPAELAARCRGSGQLGPTLEPALRKVGERAGRP